MTPRIRRVFPAVLLAVSAAAASAQYPGGGGGMGGGRGGMGGGGEGGRGSGGMGRSFEAPPNPSAKDVEKEDPVQLLLEKHKKLELDRTQIAQLNTLGASLRAQNGPYYSRVDSLHDTFKAPTSGGFNRSTGAGGDRSGMMANRELLFETLTQLRTNNKVARDSAVLLLKDPQKKKAYDMLEKQLEAGDKLIREPGHGTGMGGGRHGSSPPPA